MYTADTAEVIHVQLLIIKVYIYIYIDVVKTAAMILNPLSLSCIHTHSLPAMCIHLHVCSVFTFESLHSQNVNGNVDLHIVVVIRIRSRASGSFGGD